MDLLVGSPGGAQLELRSSVTKEDRVRMAVYESWKRYPPAPVHTLVVLAGWKLLQHLRGRADCGDALTRDSYRGWGVDTHGSELRTPDRSRSLRSDGSREVVDQKRDLSHSCDGPERAQLVISLSYDAVARFRYLVPRPGQVHERLGDDDPRLVVELLHRAHVGGVVQRARLAFAGVPEPPDAVPVRGPDRHLDGVLSAVAASHLLDVPHHPLHSPRGIVLQAEREGQIEHHLRIGRALDRGVERVVHRERQIALYAMEVPDEAVVYPQPPAVTERVAVGLLHGRARRGSDVGQEQRRLDVGGDLSEVAVVPGRLDGVENGGGLGMGGVPTEAEAVAVCGLDAEAGVEALVDEGVLGPVEQLLDEDG